jgi:hypothetical protein
MDAERLKDLAELDSPDQLQSVFAAVYLYTHAPLFEYVEYSQTQVQKIARPLAGYGH